MKTTLRENFHSISIKMVDEKKTSISISIGYNGYTVRASALPNVEPLLKGYVNGINHAMSAYLGKKVNLCGTANYGQFANLLKATVEPEKTWEGVIAAITRMDGTEVLSVIVMDDGGVAIQTPPPEHIRAIVVG